MQKFWALERTIVKHRSSSRVYLLEKEELIINREMIKPKVEGPIFRIDPSLNTQSCIKRPLCSTFRFENLSISPKKMSFFMF